MQQKALHYISFLYRPSGLAKLIRSRSYTLAIHFYPRMPSTRRSLWTLELKHSLAAIRVIRLKHEPEARNICRTLRWRYLRMILEYVGSYNWRLANSGRWRGDIQIPIVFKPRTCIRKEVINRLVLERGATLKRERSHAHRVYLCSLCRQFIRS